MQRKCDSSAVLRTFRQKYSESSEAASRVTEDTVLSRLSSLSDSVPNSPRLLPAPATKTTTAATGGATNATSNGNSQTNILQKSASFRLVPIH